MKNTFLIYLAAFAACSVLAADASPKDDVISAANSLDGQKNYSWRTIMDFGPNAQFQPGPTDGKTEKGGYTALTLNFNDNASQVVIQGTNVAVKTQDNGWQSAAEATKDNGGGFNPAAFIARMGQNFKSPASQVASLAGQTVDLKAGTNGISSALTEEGAKSLLSFRRGGGNVANAKGTITFWIADGQLVKYQTHVTGTVSFNGNDIDADRTSTTEIKDVGTTKIEVPDEARKKLE